MTDDMYTVERAVTVDAPAADVYPLLADFHAWTAWSPWEGLDPDLQRTYSGAESGTGAAYAWTGNRKAGRGRMDIVDADEPTRVEVALRFEKPFPSVSTTVFALTPDGDGTRVTWTMTGTRTRMLKVMGLVMSMDKLVGPDFEKGLARLKAVVEQGGATKPG